MTISGLGAICNWIPGKCNWEQPSYSLVAVTALTCLMGTYFAAKGISHLRGRVQHSTQRSLAVVPFTLPSPPRYSLGEQLAKGPRDIFFRICTLLPLKSCGQLAQTTLFAHQALTTDPGKQIVDRAKYAPLIQEFQTAFSAVNRAEFKEIFSSIPPFLASLNPLFFLNKLNSFNFTPGIKLLNLKIDFILKICQNGDNARAKVLFVYFLKEL